MCRDKAKFPVQTRILPIISTRNNESIISEAYLLPYIETFHSLFTKQSFWGQANHCPLPVVIHLQESIGLLLQGAEVITIWLWLVFGSIVWLFGTHLGILGTWNSKAHSGKFHLDCTARCSSRELCCKLNKAQPDESRSSQWKIPAPIFICLADCFIHWNTIINRQKISFSPLRFHL